jgi:hypothetical protein
MFQRAQGAQPQALAASSTSAYAQARLAPSGSDVEGPALALAVEHSDDLASQHVLTHQGFRARYARSGSKVCVENLGRNHRTAQALMEGWRQSPSHDRNLLNPKVERVGIAARERFVTFFACP